MTEIKDFLETIEYKITEGSDYCWDCYGPNAYQLDSWNGLHDDGGYTINCTFDKHDQTVYQLEAWDYATTRYYRWINPDYIDAVKDEYKNRGLDFENAIDSDNYIDLELADDLLEKALAMIEGQEYDTRVQVPLTLEDDDMFELMKMAHAQDLTLNQLVENLLRRAVEDHALVPSVP